MYRIHIPISFSIDPWATGNTEAAAAAAAGGGYLALPKSILDRIQVSIYTSSSRPHILVA
jgi:hypothetical protein